MFPIHLKNAIELCHGLVKFIYFVWLCICREGEELVVFSPGNAIIFIQDVCMTSLLITNYQNY